MSTEVPPNFTHGNFHGRIVDQVPVGPGTFTFTSGTKVTGTWRADGSVEDADIEYHNGIRANGLLSADGTLHGAAEVVAPCVDPERPGLAQAEFALSAMFQHGRPSTGACKAKFPCGGQFKGALNDDTRAGSGQFVRMDGPNVVSYSGEWLTDVPHGRGKMVWGTPKEVASSVTYEGDWVRGLFHGQGTLTDPSGMKYTGQFVRGAKEGEGTEEHTTRGFKYAGTFQNNLPSGHGKASYPDGGVYEGRFLNGKRHGTGVYTDPFGATLEGEWEGDVCVAGTATAAK